MKSKKIISKNKPKKRKPKAQESIDWVIKCAVDSSRIAQVLDIVYSLSKDHQSQCEFIRKTLDHHWQSIDRLSRIIEGRIASEAQKKLDSLAEQKKFVIHGREFVLVEHKRRK